MRFCGCACPINDVYYDVLHCADWPMPAQTALHTRAFVPTAARASCAVVPDASGGGGANASTALQHNPRNSAQRLPLLPRAAPSPTRVVRACRLLYRARLKWNPFASAELRGRHPNVSERKAKRCARAPHPCSSTLLPRPPATGAGVRAAAGQSKRRGTRTACFAAILSWILTRASRPVMSSRAIVCRRKGSG